MLSVLLYIVVGVWGPFPLFVSRLKCATLSDKQMVFLLCLCIAYSTDQPYGPIESKALRDDSNSPDGS